MVKMSSVSGAISFISENDTPSNKLLGLLQNITLWNGLGIHYGRSKLASYYEIGSRKHILAHYFIDLCNIPVSSLKGWHYLFWKHIIAQLQVNPVASVVMTMRDQRFLALYSEEFQQHPHFFSVGAHVSPIPFSTRPWYSILYSHITVI